MFGGMGDIMGNMKKAQEIAKQAETVNKELANGKHVFIQVMVNNLLCLYRKS